jgi:hypothetical protein
MIEAICLLLSSFLIILVFISIGKIAINAKLVSDQYKIVHEDVYNSQCYSQLGQKTREDLQHVEVSSSFTYYKTSNLRLLSFLLILVVIFLLFQSGRIVASIFRKDEVGR